MTEAGYVTTVEAAEILGKRVRTVQRMAKAGVLPVAQKLPGRTGQCLFSRQVVELIASQQEEKAS